MNEVMSKIKKNHIKFKKNLDVRIRKLINKILQIEPRKRPTCQEILDSPELIELTREFNISNQLFDSHQSSNLKSKRYH